MAALVDTQQKLGALQRGAGIMTDYKLHFELEDDCTQPRTCLETGKIYARTPRASWTQHDVDLWLGENWHEVGHHAPEVADALEGMIRHKVGFDSRLGRLINLLEDVRNEFNGYGRLVGRDYSLAYCQGHYAQRGYDMLSAPGAKSEDQFMTDVFGFVYNYRKTKQPAVSLPSLRFNEVCDYERFMPFYNNLIELSDFDSVYELAILLMDADPDVDTEEEKDESEKVHESEGEDSEELSDQEGEGEGDSGEQDSEGDGKESEGGTVKYEDLMPHTHGKDKLKGGYTTIEYTERRFDYIPYEASETKIIKARTLSMPGRYGDPTAGIERMLAHGSKLSSKVRRLFQSVTQRRTEHNMKAGRLDKRDLYRVPQGDTDVFTRKVTKVDTQGTVLYVLTDASGSMSGDKFEAAAASAALLVETMKPLRIPTKIAAFTECEGRGGLEHIVVKDFNEHRSREDIVSDYAKLESMTYQNADGDSLMIAYREIMARPERRKIIIVLSDGQPCCDKWGDAGTHLEQVIELVSKKVELYGIGLLTHAVERFYTDHTVLNSTDELEACLLDVVSTKFIR